MGLCLFCQSSDHTMRSCKKTMFKVGSCCYTCGLPQNAYNEYIHGNSMIGECSDGLRDLVKGVCWYVFRDEELREKYLGKLCREDIGMKGFRRWLGERSGDYELVNGVRLMLRVWRDRR